MGIYKRKYINLNTFKNSFSSKNKGLFGSVVIEEKDRDITIRVKASGLSLGNPYIFNIVFFDNKEKRYIYIPIGTININKNEGNFKVFFEDGKTKGFDIREAKAFFIDIQSIQKNKNLIFLVGTLDDSYSFDGNVVKYYKKEENQVIKKVKEVTKDSEKIIEEHPEENITEKNYNKQYNDIVQNSEKMEKIEIFEEILKEKHKVENNKNSQEENIYENSKEREESKQESNRVEDKEESEQKEENKKSNVRSEDYYNMLFSLLKGSNNIDDSVDSYRYSIVEKLKEEVENLAELSSKDEYSIAKDNREKAIQCNKEDEEKSIENIFRTYPSSRPFESQNFDVEWKVISLRDLGVLQKRYWKLFYEPIIVNAVEKYKELLLGKYIDEIGNERHLLAVKDEYSKSKDKSAINAGVIQFKSIIKNEEIVNGVIGYWIIKL